MNRFLLVSIIAVLATPGIMSARDGADNMNGSTLPPPPKDHMEGSWTGETHSGIKVPPPPGTWNSESHSGMKLPPMMGSGMKRSPMMGSGEIRPPMSGSGMKRPPMMGSGGVKPPVGSGAVMPPELKGLGLAMGQLKPEDRAELVKLIKDFFTRKGIDLSKYADERTEIRDVRKSTLGEIKDIRKDTLEALKLKREEMKGKIEEMRGGKVNVQDISMMK